MKRGLAFKHGRTSTDARDSSGVHVDVGEDQVVLVLVLQLVPIPTSRVVVFWNRLVWVGLLEKLLSGTLTLVYGLADQVVVVDANHA